MAIVWLHYTRSRRSTRSIAIELKHETLPALRPRAVAWLHQYWHAACSRRSKLSSHCSRIRSWPVTMHDDQGPVEKEGRHGGPLKLLTWPFGRWTIDSSLPLVHCMLRRLLSEYWRKETEKSKVFCGVVGLDGRCSAQAEQRKKPVAVVHLPGAYLSTENQLGPDSWRDEKGVWYRTDTHTHTRIKAPWTARSPALARTWHPARIINAFWNTTKGC